MYRHLKSKTSENTYLSMTINLVNQTKNSNGIQRKNRGKFNVQPIYSYLLRETNSNRTQIDLDLFVVISVRLKTTNTAYFLFLERNLNLREDVLTSLHIVHLWAVEIYDSIYFICLVGEATMIQSFWTYLYYPWFVGLDDQLLKQSWIRQFYCCH